MVCKYSLGKCSNATMTCDGVHINVFNIEEFLLTKKEREKEREKKEREREREGVRKKGRERE